MINSMSAGSGRKIKEDDSVINIADMLDKTPKLVTLQNAATAIGNGTVYNVQPGDSSITLELTGTATSVTIIFEGAIGDNYYPLFSDNLTDVDEMSSQATSLNALWDVDIYAVAKFRTRISAISGGTVSVVGRVIRD
jgi:hypothetical protein